MSDDDVDLDILALLRERLGLGPGHQSAPATTGVLSSAQFVVDNSVDVALDMVGTKAAAESIWSQMQSRSYGTNTWSEHELHPKEKDESTVRFIFTMDLLNFSFWSARDDGVAYAVEYRNQTWTGYWALVAALQRALDEGIQVTSPSFWHDADEHSDTALRDVFRSSTEEEMPLVDERIAILREAAEVLCKDFELSVVGLIESADKSAVTLVNTLATRFRCFRDECIFEDRRVRFMKRAQIFVADLWACFDGKGYGEFHDIDEITMFADYRVPQMLHTLGCLIYSPPLEAKLKKKEILEPESTLEIELRGCSIWAVEMIRKEISSRHPGSGINAILLDYFLYDRMRELQGEGVIVIPHHRTRSIWY